MNGENAPDLLGVLELDPIMDIDLEELTHSLISPRQESPLLVEAQLAPPQPAARYEPPPNQLVGLRPEAVLQVSGAKPARGFNMCLVEGCRVPFVPKVGVAAVERYKHYNIDVEHHQRTADQLSWMLQAKWEPQKPDPETDKLEPLKRRDQFANDDEGRQINIIPAKLSGSRPCHLHRHPADTIDFIALGLPIPPPPPPGTPGISLMACAPPSVVHAISTAQAAGLPGADHPTSLPLRPDLVAPSTPAARAAPTGTVVASLASPGFSPGGMSAVPASVLPIAFATAALPPVEHLLPPLPSGWYEVPQDTNAALAGPHKTYYVGPNGQTTFHRPLPPPPPPQEEANEIPPPPPPKGNTETRRQLWRNSDSNTATPTPPLPKCSNQHGMVLRGFVPYEDTPFLSCDEKDCARVIRNGQQVWSCQRCDEDLCLVCGRRRAAGLPPCPPSRRAEQKRGASPNRPQSPGATH